MDLSKKGFIPISAVFILVALIFIGSLFSVLASPFVWQKKRNWTHWKGEMVNLSCLVKNNEDETDKKFKQIHWELRLVARTLPHVKLWTAGCFSKLKRLQLYIPLWIWHLACCSASGILWQLGSMIIRHDTSHELGFPPCSCFQPEFPRGWLYLQLRRGRSCHAALACQTKANFFTKKDTFLSLF